MIYPAVILIAMLGIGALMMVTVVPELAATFTDLNAELPMSTRVVIALAGFLQKYWWAVLIGIAVIVAIARRILKTEWGKKPPMMQL